MESIDVHKVFAEYFRGCESLAYALSDKLSEGNICLDIEEYKIELLLRLQEQKARAHFKEEHGRFWVSPDDFDLQCKNETYVARSDNELKPFVILHGQAYLHRYFQYETQIIENIRRLGYHFHIITGGPGTGKTHGVSTTLAALFTENRNLKVALAAPTGKAAARMNESISKFAHDPANVLEEEIQGTLTGLKAQTIHRLLGFVPDSVFFRHDEKNRLPYDVLIVDECSMVDGAMMAKLLNAVDETTKLYLLGDKDQLASVEAGSVFGDLCRAKDEPLLKGRVELKTTSWRFSSDKGIGRFSREVISGTFNDKDSYNKDEQITIDTSYSKELFEQYVLLYKDYILEGDIRIALEKLNHIRFLCVTRELNYSVTETNKRIQRLLTTVINDKSRFNPQVGFYHNQPILITRNDYKLGIFNGDVGLIRQEGVSLFAFFPGIDGKIKKIPAGYINYFETVFAMTIHKSQGSEFENVVVILPEKQGEKLLTRELLYTAVTRAKSKALIQASEEALMKCILRTVSRASGIEKRIIQAR